MRGWSRSTSPAIAGFLELLSLTAPGLLFAALDMFVVVALLVNRPWFQWPPRDDPDADDEAR